MKIVNWKQKKNQVKIAGRTGAGTSPEAADGPFWSRAPPFGGGNHRFTVKDMDVLTYKLLQSSCPLHLVRFLVCAFISFLRKLLIFLQYTFWSLVSDPVSHSLHSFLFFFFFLSGISPGLVRRFCELITWQLLQHWKVSEYLYLSYGKFFFKEIKNQNKFGLVDSRLASCTHL